MKEIVKYYVGAQHPPKTTKPTHIGANILVVWNGMLLLERRRDCDRWGLIGGSCKRAEALDACAVRELWEETGIRVQKSRLLPLKFYDTPDRIAAFRDGSIWKMTMKLFALHLAKEPELKVSAESKELRFFSPDELKTLNIVQTHQALVEDYFELLLPNAEVRALAYLKQDELLHIDMIEPIQRGHAEILYAGTHGVLLHELHSDSYLLSADSAQSTELMLPMFTPTVYVALHHEYEIIPTQKRFALQNIMTCYQVIYPTVTEEIWGDVRVLDESYAQTLNETYPFSEGLAWIQTLLRQGSILGQFVNEKLAAFIGTHPEGAVGLLEVFPDYRRQGIGKNLILAVAKHWQEQGRTAFAQIDITNLKSLALQEKIGAKRSKNKMYWLWNEIESQKNERC